MAPQSPGLEPSHEVKTGLAQHIAMGETAACLTSGCGSIILRTLRISPVSVTFCYLEAILLDIGYLLVAFEGIV